MGFNLEMLNLWIGLCNGDKGLPQALHRLKYRHVAIEWTFSNRNNKTVTPDLIIASSKLAHTLLLDFKGGANLSFGQCLRYADITADRLRETAMLSASMAAKHDMVYVAKSEHVDRIKTGLEAAGVEFPVIAATAEGLELVLHALSDSELNGCFTPCLRIDWATVPTAYISIDEESSLWEVATVVFPVLVSKILDRLTRIAVDDVCHSTCRLWSHMGKDGRNRYRAKVVEIGEALKTSPLKKWMSWDKKYGFLIASNPLDLKAAQRAKEFARIQSAVEDFINQIKPKQRKPGEQLRLFPLEE